MSTLSLLHSLSRCSILDITSLVLSLVLNNKAFLSQNYNTSLFYSFVPISTSSFCISSRCITFTIHLPQSTSCNLPTDFSSITTSNQISTQDNPLPVTRQPPVLILFPPLFLIKSMSFLCILDPNRVSIKLNNALSPVLTAMLQNHSQLVLLANILNGA